jgi:DNA-binding GntR family transcriptional regulator
MAASSRLTLSAHPRHARLAERIVEAAVTGAWPAGARVTEQDLAQTLAVSRTPVRAALRLLARHGVVKARPNRGHVLARPGTDLAGFRLPAQASAEGMLHDALIRDRLAGRVGSELVQSDVSRRYGVGLPLVQRAVVRLEQEGLVRRAGWRCDFVPSLDTEHSRRASYELRLMLEPPALLVPGFHADPELIERLVEEHTQLSARPDLAQEDPAQVFEIDARFHEAIAGCSGNLFVLNAVRQQNALRRLLELGSYADRARIVVWCREHMAIVSAIAANDMAMASRLMRRHLMHAAEAAEHPAPAAWPTSRSSLGRSASGRERAKRRD